MRLEPKWIARSFPGLLAGLVLGIGVTQAHVTVWPRESVLGGSELYTVRVPTEKPINTVRVKLEFADNVVVSRFVPAPGWQREVTKDAGGRITSVTWAGGQIAPDELGLFQFQARNPQAGQVAFKAYQYYADNSVVEWTGPADAQTPAAMVTLAQAPLTPAQLTDAALIGQVVAAVYMLDNSGFHDLEEESANGTIPSGNLGRVQRAHMVTAATVWPQPLKELAGTLTKELSALSAALQTGDAATAAGPAHEVHEVGHDLSREAYAWLGKLGGISSATASAGAESAE